MDVDKLPKGPGGETPTLDGRKPGNPAGIYRHEAAGKEIIVMPDPTSTGQQDALVRMGYTLVAPAPTRQDLRAMQAAQEAKEAKDAKNGVVPEAYQVPGEQEVVFNGTATDVGGAGDALAAKEAENADLRARLQAYEEPGDGEATTDPEAETEAKAEVPVE